MVEIKVATSDSIVWNESQVTRDLAVAMLKNEDIILDFLAEGPDLDSLKIYELLYELVAISNYDLKKIQINISNVYERHPDIKILYHAPDHLIETTKEYQFDYEKTLSQHFGMFISRSNAPRLDLATYLDSRYSKQSLYTYHFNPTEEFHLTNIGLEDLLIKYNVADLTAPAQFLKKCPILLDKKLTTVIDKNTKLNAAQQLLKTDGNTFLRCYQDFFVEIVCESYFTGRTFFVTEKTWRPILLKTPFIVQGPQNFLNNLRQLGFKTFDRWWDEGYSEDPATWQPTEIKNIIDFLASKTLPELETMYQEMQPTLEHNRKRLLELTPTDFITLQTI